ncbi:mucin-2-like isoform X2 [Gymnodraco acuticeps]|uniref:Mucin-2-like isoform X2 n=1 Tax=Gymnodraco acuticeps TaxID=8218 RepID=A0A6P8U263_GYMAC|nr:mucin-2-like isoform X2 [Gymnodraco acuticeps]
MYHGCRPMSTQKVCQTCKQKIGVASRKCRQCGANQPYKEKLLKQKEKVAQEWKATQQKNHSVNKVYDSTNLLLHKWKLLERHPILLLAKRGTNGFAADCLCPWQIETEDGNNALVTIKKIYENLLNGTLAVEPATRVGEIPPLEMEDPSATQAEMAADPGSDSLSVPLLTTETDTVFTPILTPVSSGLTPPVSSGQSPPVSSGLTPALSFGLTPPVSSGLTPALSFGQSPRVSSGLTPALSFGLTPPVSFGLTPALSFGLTPPVSFGLTPPVSFGLTPPVSSGKSPPVSSGLTPALSFGLTPPVSSGQSPRVSSSLTPALSFGLTPPVSSGLTPTVSSVSSSQKRRPTRNKVAINGPYRGVGDVATLLWMVCI